MEYVLPPSSEYTCLEAVAVCTYSASLNGKIVVRAEMNIIATLEARVIAIMTPCDVLSRRQRFGRIWCLHFQNEEGTLPVPKIDAEGSSLKLLPVYESTRYHLPDNC